jgi:hypothetical protein
LARNLRRRLRQLPYHSPGKFSDRHLIRVENTVM